MTLEQLKNNLPPWAKDTRLNLSTILAPEGTPDLTLVQRYSIALSCAYTIKNNLLISALEKDSATHLSNRDVEAAKAAATMMAMNNVYYRFIHLVNDKSYSTMPAGLRMSVIANPGINKVDFELNCLAVSALNGCGMCIDAHAHELIKAGISKQGIQSTIRIAAVMNAAAISVELTH